MATAVSGRRPRAASAGSLGQANPQALIGQSPLPLLASSFLLASRVRRNAYIQISVRHLAWPKCLCDFILPPTLFLGDVVRFRICSIAGNTDACTGESALGPLAAHVA